MDNNRGASQIIAVIVVATLALVLLLFVIGGKL